MEILSQKFDKITLLVSIEFDKDLASIDFGKLIFTLKDENLLPIEPKISKSRFITFFINLGETITGEALKISTLHGEVITTKDKKSSFDTYPITLPIDYIKSNMVSTIASGAKGTQAATNGVTAVLFFISFNAAVVIVKLLQMLDFFQILNIDPPSNVKAFMSIFDTNIFDFFPNVFYSEEAEQECRINNKLRENGIQCAGFNNVG